MSGVERLEGKPPSGDLLCAVYPPPHAYVLDSDTAHGLDTTFDLHDISRHAIGAEEVAVPMGQAAEPAIPLLLDARGDRSVAEGQPLDSC